jgi:hypothetical protein
MKNNQHTVSTQRQLLPKNLGQPKIFRMENSQATPSTPPKLLDQVRARIRVMHYSIRNEEAYTD